MNERKIHSRKCSICGKLNKWEHGRKHLNCTKCNSIKWDKPKDEAILFNLQEEYLKTKDKNILGKMYLAMLPYAEKIILKQLPFKYEETKLEEKVQDTVTTVIQHYLKREDFKVLHSFGGTLFGPSRQELYNKRQKDKDTHEMSYDNFIGDEEKTFKDTISSEDFHDDDKYTRELVDLSNRQFLIKELARFSNEIYKAVYKNQGINKAILSLVMMHHFLEKKDEEFFDKFYNIYGTHLHELLENEKIVLLQYVREASI